MIPTTHLLKCKNLQSGVVLRVNLSFERHASKVYTRAMFEQFGEILHLSGVYRVERLEENLLYRVRHTQADRREKWSRVVFTVSVKDDGQFFDCECGLFEHMGMLCCHALKVTNMV